MTLAFRPAHFAARLLRRARIVSPVTAGLLMSIIAFLMLPVMDAIAKGLAGQVPPAQVTALRFLAQGLIMLPLALRQGGLAGLVPRRIGAHVLRLFFIATASVSFVSAVMLMPLAEATAISFLSPMLVAVLAPLVLPETVRWQHWAATLLGFAGVLVIVRPSAAAGLGELGWASLLPVLTALAFSLYLVSNRALAFTASATAMQVYAGLGVPLLLAPLLLAGGLLDLPGFGLVMPSLTQLALLIAMGAIGSLGHFLMIRSAQLASATALAPFVYLEIISATLLGYLFFADLPDLLSWVGMAIIIASGLWVIHQQRRPGLRPAP